MWRALLALLAFSTAAQAADGAQSRGIGFSDDGQYFAFEQYGTQDGSGFSYAEIFVIDTLKDAWVAPSPFRVMLEDESGSVNTALAQVHAKADPLLQQLHIGGGADVLAANPATQTVVDRKKVRFARYYNSMGQHADPTDFLNYEIEVKHVAVPQPGNCVDPDISTAVGMEIVVRSVKSGVTKTIAKDTTLPASRGCATGYDIESIQAMSGYGAKRDPLVALIGFYQRGFEGEDRRIIAVPFELFE